MRSFFIKSLSHCILKVREAQELLIRQKTPTEDIEEAIDKLDSVINTLHGLREEEIEIVRFEGQFLESRFEEDDEDEDE